jgi:hypothetical protein
MEEEQHLATDETNENMEKDKIIDNGNIISWHKCLTRDFCVQQLNKNERKPEICHESSETIFSSR